MNCFLYLASKSSDENSISHRQALNIDRSIIKAQGTARVTENERTYSTC